MQVNYVYLALVLFLSVLLLITGRVMVIQSYSSEPVIVERVSVEDARNRILKGESLLVCAYEGIERYRAVALEGSFALNSFMEIVDDIPFSKEIIFY